ncbi:MAG: hypothetical protein ACYCYM_01410 [Saccharofermentanales bacterium]
MKKIKILSINIIIAATVMSLSFHSIAASVYNTYTYHYWGIAQRSPDGYEVERVLNGVMLGSGDFSNPQDLFIGPDGDIYIADTENSRVIIYDNDFNVKKIIQEVTVDGTITPLVKPTGLFVSDDGKLFIVDTENKVVYRCSLDGIVDVIYQKPSIEFEFTGIDYIPLKVVADTNGYVYVLCKNMYQGTMMYEETGRFVSYFGANRTKMSLQTVYNSFLKKFMTKEQRARITKQVPVGIANFDIDRKNFIYTCTSATVGLDPGTEQIRKLNPKGINVLPASTSIMPRYQKMYGDLVAVWRSGRVNTTTLIDVDYDEEGYINCIDETRGRIFQYDNESNMIFAFGSTGDQEGTFKRPVAIDSYNGKIYILDSEKKNIVILKKTLYCEYVHSAINLYGQGRYAESEQFWDEVLKLNKNFNLTYLGLGKIRFEQQDYKAAMDYFRIAEDRANYGRAYKQYRNGILRSFVIQAIIIVGILALAFYILKKIRQFVEKSKALRLKNRTLAG